MSKYLKTVTRRAVFKVKHQSKSRCKKPPYDKFMVTSEEMKPIWEWHSHPWLKCFRILTSVKMTTLFQLQTTIIDHSLLLLIFWVTQNASDLTHISMVKLWSKCRVIGPMPLDSWNWRHSGAWEPKKITDVESYPRRKKSSTCLLIQGVTQSGTVTEWSSKLLRNIFCSNQPKCKDYIILCSLPCNVIPGIPLGR